MTNRETCNANEYQIYRESISYVETIPSLADDHGLRQGALGCTEKGLTTVQRIGRLSTYKPFHIFLRRGSIQNCRPESKYDRQLMSVPSTELESIPRYAQKTNVSLDHNHISGVKTFKVADRGVLLQDKWSTEFRKNDRPVEPSLIFERALSAAICVTNQLGKNWAIAYKKLSRFLEH